MRIDDSSGDIVPGQGTPAMSPGTLLIKTVIDRMVALAGLVLLAPVFGIVALAVWITSPCNAPVLFRQERVGLHGMPFTLYKFRTMAPDAEAKRDELEPLNRYKGSPYFKVTDDPRITPLGRILRRASLDELPQLWNVLRAEMSVVGPRPALAEEFRQLAPEQRRRVLVKPGITGLSQVHGRSDLSFEEWMRLDIHYVDNCSLWLDLFILLRTPVAVLTGRGAL